MTKEENERYTVRAAGRLKYKRAIERMVNAYAAQHGYGKNTIYALWLLVRSGYDFLGDK